MSARSLAGWVALLAAIPIAPISRLDAQVRGGAGAAGGVEWRQFRVGSDSGETTIRQLMVPVGVTWGRGPWTVDLGSAWVQSRLSFGADGRTVSSLTDTQIRATYTFGLDRVVASVVANLPTGLSKAPVEDFPVLGAISSSFYGFPVASHGSGFSTTGGLAFAIPAGEWNVGLAGSLRWTGEYTPYEDVTGPFTYRPGVEGRVRAGVDRIVGRSRVTGGVTFSTFGTDEFGGGSAVTGLYRPGNRWVAEAGVVAPVASRATLSLIGWHYQRSDGDSASIAVSNRERITAGAVKLLASLRSGLELEVSADARSASLAGTPGHLVGAELSLGLSLGPRVSLQPSVRYDTGALKPIGGRLPVRGFGASVFLRSR